MAISAVLSFATAGVGSWFAGALGMTTLNAAGATVLTTMGSYVSSFTSAFVSSSISGLINSAVSGDFSNILKDAAISGITASLFSGVHFLKGALGIPQVQNIFSGSFNLGSALISAGLHGAVGCVSAVMKGSGCGSGAAGAALGDLAGNFQTGSGFADFLLTSTFGGIGSSITGGDFTMGFINAGLGYLFNQALRLLRPLPLYAVPAPKPKPNDSPDLLSNPSTDFLPPSPNNDNNQPPDPNSPSLWTALLALLGITSLDSSSSSDNKGADNNTNIPKPIFTTNDGFAVYQDKFGNYVDQSGIILNKETLAKVFGETITPGKLTGTPDKISINDDASTILGKMGERYSANVLLKNGYDVEQRPNVEGNKRPDLRISGQGFDGDIFDVYSPTTNNIQNIAGTIQRKVESGQASNIVLNLQNSPTTPAQIQDQLKYYPIDGLKNIIVIDENGKMYKLKL